MFSRVDEERVEIASWQEGNSNPPSSSSLWWEPVLKEQGQLGRMHCPQDSSSPTETQRPHNRRAEAKTSTEKRARQQEGCGPRARARHPGVPAVTNGLATTS